jgi:DNA-binding response OmpR family regulator
MTQLDQLEVLVIAANQNMRAQLRSMLDQFGILEIQSASSAGTAINRLRERRYDLILCEHDLGDDNQDGQHLLEDLRSRRIIALDTLFIMISGERSYERVVGAAELAPNDYILKPLTPGTLQMRIERAVAKRDAFQPVFRLLEAGQQQAAVAECERAELRHPKWRTDFMRLRAEAALELGQLDEADRLYAEVVSATGAPWARLGRARVLIAAARYTEAEPILEELVNESEHYLDAYDLLALCREYGGHAPRAAEALDDAIRRSPRRLGRLRRFGKLATQIGQLERAESAMQQVVQLGKRSEFRDPADHVELSRVQLLREHADQAGTTIADLEKTMGALPAGKACAALGKAMIARHTGNRNAAREAALTAARAALDTAELPLELKHDIVRECLAAGLDDEGGALVGEILRNASDEQTIRQTRALLDEQGRKDLSEEVEERLHAEVRGYVATGAKLAQAGDYEGAVSEMLGAVRKMPGNPHVLFNAALALLRHIEHNGWNERLAGEARTLIARTRKVDPSNPKLEAMTNFMAGLERKYGMQPHAVAAAASPKGGPVARK